MIINDPKPLTSTEDALVPAAQLAIIGIFIVVFGAVLYFARPILLPFVAALIIAMTLAPVVKFADRHRIPPWAVATFLVLSLAAAAATVLTLMSSPVIALIDRAPEIAASIKQKLYVLEFPLGALRDLQNTLMPPSPNTVKVEPSQITLVAPVVAAVTPAVTQIAIFGATLFFALVSQADARRHVTSLLADREAKLRFLRIANDVEHNLASYVATVTTINITLGAVVAAGAWIF